MTDDITVRGEPGYTPAPEGQWQAVCADVIDLGERVESFQGGTPKIVKKVALVFQLSELNPDTGRPFEPATEKTLAFGPSSGLRKFLSQWRGKAYGDAEAAAGVNLAKLVGVNAIIQIEHKISASGRTYAKISNIMPPMAKMPKLTVHDYERSEHWVQRRADYAQETQRHRATVVPVAATTKTRNGQPMHEADDVRVENRLSHSFASSSESYPDEPPF
jgi:hypothetical protein